MLAFTYFDTVFNSPYWVPKLRATVLFESPLDLENLQNLFDPFLKSTRFRWLAVHTSAYEVEEDYKIDDPFRGIEFWGDSYIGVDRQIGQKPEKLAKKIVNDLDLVPKPGSFQKGPTCPVLLAISVRFFEWYTDDVGYEASRLGHDGGDGRFGHRVQKAKEMRPFFENLKRLACNGPNRHEDGQKTPEPGPL